MDNNCLASGNFIDKWMEEQNFNFLQDYKKIKSSTRLIAYCSEKIFLMPKKNEYKIYSPTSHEVIQNLNIDLNKEFTLVKFLDADTLVFLALDSRSVHIFNLVTNSMIKIWKFKSCLCPCMFILNANRFWVASTNILVELYFDKDTCEITEKITKKLKTNQINDITGNKRIIITGNLDRSLHIYKTKTLEMKTFLKGVHTGGITNVFMSPEEDYILTMGSDPWVNMISCTTFEITFKLNFHGDKPISLAFIETQKVLISSAKEFRIFTICDGLLNAIIPASTIIEDRISRVLVDELYQLYVIANRNETIRVFDLKKIVTTTRHSNVILGTGIDNIVINQHSTILAGTVYKRLIISYNMTTKKEMTRYFVAANIENLHWKNSITLLVCCSDGKLYLVNAESQEEIIELDFISEDMLEHYAASPIAPVTFQQHKMQTTTNNEVEIFDNRKISLQPILKEGYNVIDETAKKKKTTILRGTKTIGGNKDKETIEIYQFEINRFQINGKGSDANGRFTVDGVFNDVGNFIMHQRYQESSQNKLPLIYTYSGSFVKSNLEGTWVSNCQNQQGKFKFLLQDSEGHHTSEEYGSLLTISAAIIDENNFFFILKNYDCYGAIHNFSTGKVTRFKELYFAGGVEKLYYWNKSKLYVTIHKDRRSIKIFQVGSEQIDPHLPTDLFNLFETTIVDVCMLSMKRLIVATFNKMKVFNVELRCFEVNLDFEVPITKMLVHYEFEELVLFDKDFQLYTMSLRTKTTCLISKTPFLESHVIDAILFEKDYTMKLYIVTDDNRVMKIEFERRSFLPVSTLQLYYRNKVEKKNEKYLIDTFKEGSYLQEIGIDIWTCLFHYWDDIDPESLNTLLKIAVRHRVTPCENDKPLSCFEVLIYKKNNPTCVQIFFYYYFQKMNHLTGDNYTFIEDLFLREFITNQNFQINGIYEDSGVEFYNGFFKKVLSNWEFSHYNSPLKNNLHPKIQDYLSSQYGSLEYSGVTQDEFPSSIFRSSIRFHSQTDFSTILKFYEFMQLTLTFKNYNQNTISVAVNYIFGKIRKLATIFCLIFFIEVIFLSILEMISLNTNLLDYIPITILCVVIVEATNIFFTIAEVMKLFGRGIVKHVTNYPNIYVDFTQIICVHTKIIQVIIILYYKDKDVIPFWFSFLSSISIIFTFMRQIRLLRIFDAFIGLLIILQDVLIDIIPVTILSIAILIGFAFTFYSINQSSDNGNISNFGIWNAFLSSVDVICGDYNIALFNSIAMRLALFAAIFTIYTVLFNLIIALMSDAVIRENKTIKAKISKNKLDEALNYGSMYMSFHNILRCKKPSRRNNFEFESKEFLFLRYYSEELDVGKKYFMKKEGETKILEKIVPVKKSLIKIADNLVQGKKFIGNFSQKCLTRVFIHDLISVPFINYNTQLKTLIQFLGFCVCLQLYFIFWCFSLAYTCFCYNFFSYLKNQALCHHQQISTCIESIYFTTFHLVYILNLHFLVYS